MHKNVFISFVEQDLKIAKIIKNKLYEEGISAWIYTEDNIVGDYRTGIMQAITTSDVMILIFSGHTEKSQHIPKELREASENNIVIIPFFIEDIKKIENEIIRYEIQTLNWIQGWKKPLDDQINVLINKTKSVLGDMTPTPSNSPKKNHTFLIIMFLVLILLSYGVATKVFHYPLLNIDNTKTELISPNLYIQDTAEEATIKQFLIDYFATGEKNSADKILKFFSSTVNPYLNIEKASREQILQDKIDYIKRWPQRKYTLNSFTILDTYKHNDKKYFEVSYTYDWQVHSNKLGTASGTGTSIMKIQKKGNKFLILGIRDIVSNDKKHVNNTNLTFKDNGILLTIQYPKSIKMGEDFIMEVTMVNKLKTSYKGGGLTLSFPGILSNKVNIIKSNFSSVNSFSPPAHMYNLTSGKNESIKYLAIEGWHSKKWDYNEEKSFSIKLRSPIDMNQMRVDVRGILKIDNKDVLNPQISTSIDQQGYHVNQFEIKSLKQI